MPWRRRWRRGVELGHGRRFYHRRQAQGNPFLPFGELFWEGDAAGGLPFGSSFPVVALTPAVGYNEIRSLLGPESYHELLGHS